MDTKKHQLPTPFPTALTCAEKYYLKYIYIYILFASFVHCCVFAVCIHFQEAGKNPSSEVIRINWHELGPGAVTSCYCILWFWQKESLNKIIRKFEKGDAVVWLLFLFKRYKVWIWSYELTSLQQQSLICWELSSCFALFWTRISFEAGLRINFLFFCTDSHPQQLTES